MILNIGILIVLAFWFLIGIGAANKGKLELSSDNIGSFLFLLFLDSLLFIAIIYIIQRILE